MLDQHNITLAKTGNDMGRAIKPLNVQRIEYHLNALIASAFNRPDFDAAFAELKNDRQLMAADVIEIARQFRGGGVKPKSKKAAIDAIERRFVEKVRTEKNKLEAARARPW
ncbi:MAG: hypothetical protein AAFR90_02830 [Pseudomonadota bacterium]